MASGQFASYDWVAHWVGAGRAEHYVEAIRRFEERGWASWSWSWPWFFFEWLWFAYRKAPSLVLAACLVCLIEVQLVLRFADENTLLILHVLLMKAGMAIFAERVFLRLLLGDARRKLSESKDLLADEYRNRYGPVTAPAHTNPELFW